MMDNRRLGQDLISDLPVGVIENILACLPIGDAIRTSILSTKWRFRWTTLPHLVFEKRYMNLPLDNFESEEIDNRFKSYVTSTLLRHEGPIHKFKLASRLPNCSEVHQWLLYLLRKDVKELILHIYRKHDLPSSLFSFQSLTCLEIRLCRFGPLPPNFKGFLSLKSLLFAGVDVPARTIQSFVAHSPLLETLKLFNCQMGPLPTLIINGPKLKNLHLMLDKVKNIHLCAPLLAKVILFVDYKYDINYTEFFGGVPNLETLVGVFTKLFIFGIEHHQQPLVFQYLKIIKLNAVNFNSIGEILVVVRLIVDASATLCELHLSNSGEEKEEEEKSETPGVNFWHSNCPQNCTFGKLKSVEVANFRGGIHEMEFIKFVLASSPVLEKMTVRVADCNKPTEKHILNSTVQLLSYCRASSATILLKDIEK